MSRINLINIETRGVDMKTNPLLLGNKKMHSATNLVFEEGVIKTRPGFRYKALGCTGQFQGAGEFRPRKGLSATPLSESKAGFVVVADGKIWLNCKKIGEPFSCNENVHVFQAENYLIFQNPNSSTFWWDGEKLTESPGMVDIDFEEIETPVQEVAVVAPAISTPTCGIEVSTSVTFTVRDSTTSAIVENALVTVYKDGVTVKSGNTDAKGKIYFALLAGTYTYSSTATGFSVILNKPVTSGVAFVDYTYESCAAPLKLLSGENLVEVRLLPISLSGPDVNPVPCINIDQTGPFGPGYDNFPDVLHCTDYHNFPTLIPNFTTSPRSETGGKTIWWNGSHGGYIGFSNPCLWSVTQSQFELNSNINNIGYKPGQFTDGPLGNYYSNIDGTGNLMFTVT